MADEKSHLPKRASPPSQGAGIPPPPREIQRRDVVWLDKGYTPPASPSLEQQHTPAPDADIPPPPRELVWLQKGYSPPAHEPRKSILCLFGFGDDDKKLPDDIGDIVERQQRPADKPKPKSVARIFGLGDDDDAPGDVIEKSETPPPDEPSPGESPPSEPPPGSPAPPSE